MTFKEVIAQWTDKTKEIGARINNKVVTIKFCPDDPENKTLCTTRKRTIEVATDRRSGFSQRWEIWNNQRR